MDRRSKTFRLTVWLAAASLLATASVTGTPSRAQDAGAAPGADPPARVGRLARLQGSVSAHGPDATQWTPAVLNFPFVSGDALWTQPQAQADIEIGASLATLADSTEFDLVALDDQNLVASEPQGAVFLDLRQVRAGETYTINTPRGAVQIATNGEYEILAGDTDTPTRVAVVRGAAQLTSGAVALRAGQGQIITETGDQANGGNVQPLTSYDPFLTAMLARNSPPVTVPPVAQGMTGAESLGQYGSWQNSPDYGEVWYPQVAPDWVPYRDGSWSYVAPWGWTWVDNEPWGFAPFHYGRWAQIRQRWCWVPGEPDAPVEAEPVYAPALVDFVVAGAVAGAAAGAIAASLASGRGDIGWVPLGPREAYSPPYGGSSRYLSRLNRGHGWHRPEWGDGPERNTRATVINNTRNVFINRGALTVAPSAAFARSQQIRPVARGIESPAARGFQSSAAPLRGSLPIRPVAETRGLGPRAAQQLGLGRGPAQPPAPGPSLRAAALQPAVPPGGRIPPRGPAGPVGSRPPLAAAPGPEIRHAPTAPHPPGRPVAPGLPPLRPGSSAAPGRPFVAPPPRAAVPRGPELPMNPPAALPHPAPAFPPQRLEAPRAPAPGVTAPRPVAPRPVAPRLAAPLPPAPRPFEPRPAPPRPVEPHFAPSPPAFHSAPMRPPMPQAAMPRPMPAPPQMGAPRFQPPRPMAAPHAAAPPPAPRPAGQPPHP